jgi:hypothetical protein
MDCFRLARDPGTTAFWVSPTYSHRIGGGFATLKNMMRKQSGAMTTLALLGASFPICLPIVSAQIAVQAQSQPDNIAIIPLLTATFVRPVQPVA